MNDDYLNNSVLSISFNLTFSSPKTYPLVAEPFSIGPADPDITTDNSNLFISDGVSLTKISPIPNEKIVSLPRKLPRLPLILPLNQDYLNWPFETVSVTPLIYKVPRSKVLFIAIYDTPFANRTNIKVFYKDEHEIIKEYYDINLRNGSFERILHKKGLPLTTYLLKDEKVVKTSKSVNVSRWVEPLPLETDMDSKIMTIDIETYIKDGQHFAYAAGVYESSWLKPITFYKTNDSIDVIEKMLKLICIPKYHNYTIYAHNLGGFDGWFILKYLASIGEIKVIKNKMGNFIMIDLTIPNPKRPKNPYRYHFKDSLQLLGGASLR
ncbi:hypothetical protein HK100_010797, partial [Physocladia obscura]